MGHLRNRGDQVRGFSHVLSLGIGIRAVYMSLGFNLLLYTVL